MKPAPHFKRILKQYHHFEITSDMPESNQDVGRQWSHIFHSSVWQLASIGRWSSECDPSSWSVPWATTVSSIRQYSTPETQDVLCPLSVLTQTSADSSPSSTPSPSPKPEPPAKWPRHCSLRMQYHTSHYHQLEPCGWRDWPVFCSIRRYSSGSEEAIPALMAIYYIYNVKYPAAISNVMLFKEKYLLH